MALARIISNSPLCSRELALNLLERGYAVEIVSPDEIPDNLADLELRVETGPADLLNAKVEARSETRSASLEFIHQLKSPSLEVKRPPRDAEPVAVPDLTIPALAISANPLPALAAPASPLAAVAPCEPIPISVSAVPAVGPVLVKTEVVVAPPPAESDAASADPPKKPAAFSEGAALIVVRSPSPEGVQEVAAQKATQPAKPDMEMSATPVFKVIIPKPSLPSLTISRVQLKSWKGLLTRCNGWVRRIAIRPAGWFGWSVLGFAGLMALGLALELVSVRMSHPDRAPASGIPAADTASAVNGVWLLPPVADENNNVSETKPQAIVPSRSAVGTSAALRVASSGAEKHSAIPEKHSAPSKSVSRSKLFPASPAPKIAKRQHSPTQVIHSDDVVAPDTITYFNRPGATPVPVKELARQRADSHKPSQGALAANAISAAANSGSGK